jgi:hypothetical protein
MLDQLPWETVIALIEPRDVRQVCPQVRRSLWRPPVGPCSNRVRQPKKNAPSASSCRLGIVLTTSAIGQPPFAFLIGLSSLCLPPKNLNFINSHAPAAAALAGGAQMALKVFATHSAALPRCLSSNNACSNSITTDATITAVNPVRTFPTDPPTALET